MSAARALTALLVGCALVAAQGCGSSKRVADDPTVEQTFSLHAALRAMPAPRSRVPLAILLPPIESEGSARRWLPTAFALLRERADLRLSEGSFRPSSAAAFFGWVRSQADPEQTYWCVDLGGAEAAQIELLAARSTQSWRSGPIDFVPGDAARSLHPFATPDALDRIVCEQAEGLHVEGDAVHLVVADGLRKITLEDGRLRLDELRSWSALRRSPLDRRGLLLRMPESIVLDAGGRRFDFDLCDGSWWLAATRLGDASPAKARALSAWPGRPGEWLLLEPDGRGLRWHRGPWRVRPERSPSRRAAPAPLLLQSGPLVEAMQPWREAGGRSVLALREPGDEAAHAVAPYRVEAEDREGGRWKIEVDGLRSELLARALEAAWAATPAWLRADRELTTRARRSELQLRLSDPLPDLLERLAHPALWLSDPALPVHAGRPGTRAWRTGEGAALRLPAQSTLRGATDALRGDRAPVVLLPSALCPPAMRRALRSALAGREFFAQAEPGWSARTPIFGESPPTAPRTPSPIRASLYLRVEADTLPLEERERVLQRLGALLQSAGIAMQLVDDFESLRLHGDDAVARVVRLPLYAGDPLLRAAELADWLRVDAGIAPRVWNEAPRSAARDATATRFERRLLEEGLLFPLWTLPLDLELPAGFAVGGLCPVGMPPLLWDLHERGCRR